MDELFEGPDARDRLRRVDRRYGAADGRREPRGIVPRHPHHQAQITAGRLCERGVDLRAGLVVHEIHHVFDHANDGARQLAFARQPDTLSDRALRGEIPAHQRLIHQGHRCGVLGILRGQIAAMDQVDLQGRRVSRGDAVNVCARRLARTRLRLAVDEEIASATIQERNPGARTGSSHAGKRSQALEDAIVKVRCLAQVGVPEFR